MNKKRDIYTTKTERGLGGSFMIRFQVNGKTKFSKEYGTPVFELGEIFLNTYNWINKKQKPI